MEARFLREPGNLACKLMAALQGAKVAGADTRCISSGNSSLSSFLRVAQPWDDSNNPSINLNVPSGPPGFEPIDSLQTLFDSVMTCTTTVGMHHLKFQDVKVNYERTLQQLTISGSVSAIFQFELYNSLGGKIFSQSNGSTRINVSDLPSGVYLWMLKTEGNPKISGKVIVSRNH